MQHGVIVSHDPSLHTGLILPEGSTEAIKFSDGDILNWGRHIALHGIRVTFQYVRTSNGVVAVHIRIVDTIAKTPRETLKWIMFFAPLLCVGLFTGALNQLLNFPPVMASIVAVNVVNLFVAMNIASSPIAHHFTPLEVSSVVLSFFGGAPSIIISSLFLDTKFRWDAFKFLFVTVSIAQIIILHTYFPEVLELQTWRNAFLNSKL